jgi:E1A/CREB-binding protein
MQKIRRNAVHYTDRLKQNHWCDRCYTRLKDGERVLLDDGRETKKSLLLKLKNDSNPEESWIQCGKCQSWNHQICALVNGTQSSKSSFTCPKCHIKSLADSKTKYTPAAPSHVTKGATNLPHCKLSRSIEDGLEKVLSEAYEKVAEDRGCTVNQVEKVDGLCVRVLSSLDKKHKVREEMLARYARKGYPSEFKVTTKCIVLFQKIHGVDVLLFGMYVYEYGDECAGPNRRRVYISYLDSVRYLEPASYRTITYQTVITEYLRFVKLRGFHTAHIWSCPPAKGDEYIFHCHPNHQLTPNDDLLCAWYVEMLSKAKDEGIVLETRTLYDEYFKNNATNPDTGDAYDPTSVPYFEGDYIPGEIEKIIKELNVEESKREGSKLKGTTSKGGIQAPKKQEGKRRGTRSNPGDLVNQARDKVMNRLDLVLARMKKNFMVAQLLSDEFIQAVEKGQDVTSWKENSVVKNSKQKGKNPNLLHNNFGDKAIVGKQPELKDDTPSQQIWTVVGDTKDHDPIMEQECIETRLHFLNFCQRNHYQFDELRRAKYTTMMFLAHLHKPRAEQDQQIKAHLNVIAHAASCNGFPKCSSTNCQRMKQLFQHIQSCDVTYKRGCKTCTRMFMLLTKHSRDCSQDVCPIPFCNRIKERTRLLLKQQQMMDDRRRNAQNDRLKQESAAPEQEHA